jgi:hypothetical protein
MQVSKACSPVCPIRFEATRYHSLVVERDSLPDCLEITAWTEDERRFDRGDHGAAPSQPCGRGRAVPSRIHPDPSRARPAEAISWRTVATARSLPEDRTNMPITPQEALQRTIDHREIFHDEMVELVRMIMRGEVSPVMSAAILTGLRVKKETVGEIAAAATVMREFAAKVDVPDAGHFVDIVGTGGDGAHTFNISTASMFVAAAAGAKVAKHGNRSVSSKSGSADVLEALGARIELHPAQVAQVHPPHRHRFHVRAHASSRDEERCGGPP